MTEPWPDGPPPNAGPFGLPPEDEKPRGMGPWILAGVICTAAVVAVIIAVVVVVNGGDSKAASDSQDGAASSSQGSQSSSAPPSSSGQPGPNTSGNAPQGPNATAAPTTTAKPTTKKTSVAPTTTAQPEEEDVTSPMPLETACSDAGSAQNTKIARDASIGSSSGEPVYVMTSLLYHAGYLSTGSYLYSSSIEKAATSFQVDNGLEADGIVGADTWSALINVVCN